MAVAKLPVAGEHQVTVGDGGANCVEPHPDCRHGPQIDHTKRSTSKPGSIEQRWRLSSGSTISQDLAI